MDEIERQLRRYADAAEARVPATPEVPTRRRSWRPLLATAAIVALVGGSLTVFLTTRSADEQIDAGPADESSRPAMQALRDRGLQLYEFAATDDWLVGLSGYDTDHPDQTPEYASVPLAGGEVVAIELPVGDDHFSPTRLVADDDHAVIVGNRCSSEPVEPEVPEQRFCRHGDLAAFRIEPATGEAAPLEVDPELGPVDSVGVSVTASQRRDGGWWLFGVRMPSGRAADDPLSHTVLIDATPERLELVATWPGRAHTCVAGTHAYQLEKRLPTDGAMDLTVDAALELRRIAIPSGEIDEVPLPSVSSAYGAVMVHLACAGPTALLTSAGAPTEPDPRVFAWDGANWIDRPDLVPPDAISPSLTTSDGAGALIPWSVGDPRRPRARTVAIPADGSEPSFLDADVVGAIWRGTTGDLIAVHPGEERRGPYPGLDLVTVWE